MEAPHININNVKEEEVNAQDGDNASTFPPEDPSFKGKLNLSTYNFSATLKPEIKNESPSQSQSLSSLPSSGSSSRKSTKRKAASSTAAPPRLKKRPSGYAPPSTYAHLPELRDTLVPNLICVFIGLNPGITTATSGHAYAHPSNLFWKLLHSSGITPRRCSPTEDGDLPHLFSLGNTNIVSRPTRNGSELTNQEMDDSVKVLEEKIARVRPEAVCIVGKSIWESVWRVKHGGKKMGKGQFKYGWQVGEEERMGSVEGEGGWEGARVFVATTTSALAATMSLAEKQTIWRELGSWVEKRREERAAEEGSTV